SKGRYVASYHAAGADKCIRADGHAADDRAIGPEGGAAAHDGVAILGFALDLGTRVIDIGKDHAGTAEHSVLQRHVVIDRDVVLNLHLVADPDLVADEDVLPQRAVLANHGSTADM